MKTYSDNFIAERRRRSSDGLCAPQYDALYSKRKPRHRPPFNLARRRINEIEMLIERRHGVIPATDDADHYVWIVAQHLRELNASNLHDQLIRWCSRWAPEMPADEVEAIAARALRKEYRFTADVLADKLGVTYEERKALGITTIGAKDRTVEERAEDRAQNKRPRDKANAERRRRQKGARPRGEYEAMSLTQTKPWEADGISRRTWERRRERIAQQPPEGWRDFSFAKKAA